MTLGNWVLSLKAVYDEISGEIGTFQLYIAWATTMHAENYITGTIEESFLPYNDSDSL